MTNKLTTSDLLSDSLFDLDRAKQHLEEMNNEFTVENFTEIHQLEVIKYERLVRILKIRTEKLIKIISDGI